MHSSLPNSTPSCSQETMVPCSWDRLNETGLPLLAEMKRLLGKLCTIPFSDAVKRELSSLLLEFLCFIPISRITCHCNSLLTRF